jgi:HlyD family secretion protein
MNNRTLIKIFLPIVILVIAGGIYSKLLSEKSNRVKPELKEKVWQLDTVKAVKQNLSPSITLYGRIESPELLKAAAPGNGIVASVKLRNGIRVKKGQQLMTMDRRDFDSALIQAKANLSDIDNQIEELRVKHQSNLAFLETERNLFKLASAEVERQLKLQKQNLSTEAALNDARSTQGTQQLAVLSRELEVNSYASQLQILKARRERDKALYDEANLAMERTDIRAPFDAIISEVSASTGDRVMEGQTLVSLYPVNSLEIRAHLPAIYLDSILQAKVMNRALFARVTNRETLGKFELIRVAGEAEASGIDVYFQANTSPEQLRPGELLPLSLTLPAENKVIAIPYQAIYGNSRIYLNIGNRLEAVEVATVGQYLSESGETKLLIRSNKIQQGDEIIVTHLPNAVTGLKIQTGKNASK